MQRVLVILAVIVLVAASLSIGALAANWPFWRRAWQWHAADGGWPDALPGPHAVVRGGGAAPLHFDAARPDLAALAGTARTTMLLRAGAGRADAWLAPGANADDIVDGRGFSALLLAPLFDELGRTHAAILDRPVGAWIEPWRQDVRGALTPRALLAHVQEGVAAPASFTALNPFSARARLASGPDFSSAALAAFGTPASGAEPHPAAAAQLLADVAAAADSDTFAAVLERRLWKDLAAGDAMLVMDRRRGGSAVHCCARARASDWLRLGLRLTATRYDQSRERAHVLATQGRALVLSAAGGVVLWIGEGDPPSGLEMLLSEPVAMAGTATGAALQ